VSTPFTFLLFGAAIFLAIAAIGIIRGIKLKERAYCISGLVCVLLSLWMVLMYFSQFVLGMGFFIAGAIIGLANYSKSMKAASREAVTSHKETDVSKPLKIIDLFSWGGWFKIASRWGIRKALLFYILFNLGSIWVIPLVLLILNVGSFNFIVFIAIFVTVGVVISSVPIFNQQIVKNLEVKKDH
jgi:hypothetical protein